MSSSFSYRQAGSRRYIDDSSSSSSSDSNASDTDSTVVNSNNHHRRRKDSLLDDSSDESSIGALLEDLRVDCAQPPQQIVVDDIIEDSSEDDAEIESVVSSSSRSSWTKEHPSIPNDSNWVFDRSTKNFSLSSDDSTMPNLLIPETLFTKLFDYQKTGVEWIAGLHNSGMGGLLGDDMGMGKTFMTLTYLGGLLANSVIRRALIVAPVSVLRSWEKEAKKILSMCTNCNVNIQVLGSNTAAARRQRILSSVLSDSRGKHIVISTYGMISSDPLAFVLKENDQMDRAFFDYVVLDEGHKIKNPSSATSKACRRICKNPATRRLMLTGTPILNRLVELWALFDWTCSKKLLKSSAQFMNRYGKPIENARSALATNYELALGNDMNKKLQAKLAPFFLQRLKVDYLADRLPPKQELVVWTHLSSLQRELYTKYVKSDPDVVRAIMNGEKISPLAAVTWLKKLCGHPILANHAAEEVADVLNGRSQAQLLEEAPKLPVLVSLMKSFQTHNHRALIFSQSTKMLDVIESILRYEGFRLCRIDGSTKEKDRQAFVDEFNAEYSDYEACLVSTKAGGVGLTLTGADRVIIYDPSWTPADDSQAVDRCYRIGQIRPVFCYRLLAAGTVEEKMYEKQLHKDGIRRTVFTDDDNIERLFDSNGLKKLFTLSEPGVCEVMAKCSQVDSNQMEPNEYKMTMNLGQVVGLSPHDGFYRGRGSSSPSIVSVIDEDATTPVVNANDDVPDVIFVDEPSNKDNSTAEVLDVDDSSGVVSPKEPEATMRLEEVPFSCNGDEDTLTVDDDDSQVPQVVDPLPSEKQENDQSTSNASKPLPCNEISSSSPTKNGTTENHLVLDVIREADAFVASGRPRRALRLLTHTIENHPEIIVADHKIAFHKKVASLAGRLGLSIDS